MSRPGVVASAALVASLALAGCEPRQEEVALQPDAVPSARSAAVLSGYADEVVPPPAPAGTVSTLPVPRRQADLLLPGEPDSPWTGAPRNLVPDPLLEPSRPEKPVQVAEPRPVAPERPELPLKPEHPQKPVKSNKPEKPERPERPEKPEKPVAPPDQAAPPHDNGQPVQPPAARRLTPGDIVEIRVERHSEFSGRWTVRPDGFLGVSGEADLAPRGLLEPEAFSKTVGRVAEQSAEKTGELIARALRDYVKAVPVVTVSVLDKREG